MSYSVVVDKEGKVFVVANQKGGIGKTTVARHQAWYWAEKGERVCLTDFDVQKNLTLTGINIGKANGLEWDDKSLVVSDLFSKKKSDKKPFYCGDNLWLVAADPGIVTIERGDLDENIQAARQAFAQLRKEFDKIVVDTSPSVSSLLIVALTVGDFAVAPCKPDRDAINGLIDFFMNVTRVRDDSTLNPKLSALGVLPNQIVRDRATHRSMVNDMREAWGDGVLPVELFERAAIDSAKDRPVWKTDRGESKNIAATEMKNVCAYLDKQMGA